VSKKRGLPDNKKMRHSPHFIDSLFSRDENHVGKMISIESLEVNPDQPRKNLGDLEGLIASIHSYGILEPLLVSPKSESSYKIIAGERRYHAALACGLTEIPCIEIAIQNPVQNLEIALIENLQRQDLDAFEEAFGYQVLQDKYGYTQELISEKIGKKRSTVAEILGISQIPEEIRELCRHADITAKSMLLEIVKAGGLKEMREIIDAIMAGKGREAIRQMRKKKSKKNSSYHLDIKADDFPIRLRIHFQSEKVQKEELISFLQKLIDQIRSDEIKLEKLKT